MISLLSRFKKEISTLNYPILVTHIDADGITSGSIISLLLDKLEIDHKIINIKQLCSDTIKDIQECLYKEGSREVIFTDMGSGQISLINKNFAELNKAFIIDHHLPEVNTGGLHLNCHFFGIDGSNCASASTLAFLVAKEFNFLDCVPLAIVGAVGDLQTRKSRKLVGLNSTVVELGKKVGLVEKKVGLSFFGRETRPLSRFLTFASTPYLPGLSSREQSCADFIIDQGINLVDISGEWRTYHDLTFNENKKLVSALYIHCLKHGCSAFEIQQLLHEYYIFPKEKKKTELRDATEFSTLLNACGRWEKSKIGIGVCKGNKDCYEQAQKLLRYHRRKLREGLQEIEAFGIRDYGKIVQYFYSDKIKPAIVGIVTGMALGSMLADINKVLIGIVHDNDGILKVSGRASQNLVAKGINLASAMNTASTIVEGEGGGHDIAAGSYIPFDKMNIFIEALDRILHKQINKSNFNSTF